MHRTNLHIYAQRHLATTARKVLASASTLEADVRKELATPRARAATSGRGGDVGKRIAEKAKAAGIEKVAFDRAGFATTAASRRWPTPRAKPACSSKREADARISNMAKFQPTAHSTEEQRRRPAEKMIAVNRVTKVVKGGRILGFAALTVVGDGDGRIGMGKGKAQAKCRSPCRRRWKQARRNMVKVPLKNGTLHHDVIGQHGAAKVLMQPAPRHRHHRRRPDARRVRSDGRDQHRRQVPRLDQPVQHRARHARRAEAAAARRRRSRPSAARRSKRSSADGA